MVLPYVDGSPEFSWRIASERQNLMQAAYEIKVFIGNEPIWSSGKTDSCEQSFVPYGGELRSCASYRWQLTVWDNYGNSATSDSYFETAFLSINEWKGCWAQSTLPRNEAPLFTYGVENPALRFSKKFDLPSSAVSARLYATC